MSTPRLSQDLINEAVKAVEEHGSVTEAAKALGLPRATLRDRCNSARAGGGASNSKEPTPLGEKWDVTETKDQKQINSFSWEVRTVKDALRKAEIDTVIWEVEKTNVNSYPIAMKLKQVDKSHKVVERWLWQVKVFLRRRIPLCAERSAEAWIERMEKFSPKFPPIKRVKRDTSPHLLELGLVDSHYGKLARRAETGDSYDLVTARQYYRNALEDLTEKASPWNIEKFVLPIGQDFFHIDNTSNTTAKGTPQDVDGRLHEIYAAGVESVINGIAHLLRIAPVQVIWVPGNHDPMTSWYMSREVATHYRHCKEVEVDYRPMKRKFFTYGKNGIMLTHAECEKHSDLPIIMASEDRKAWAETEYSEIHCGHLHKKKETYFVGADTHGGGVVVRLLPSLSGVDKYHADHGWTKGEKAAIGFLFGKEPGLVATFNAPARAA
jgi:hypothetical protein